MAKAKSDAKSDPVAYTAAQDVYVNGIYTKAGDPFVTDADPDDSWTKVNPKDLPAITASTQEVPPDASIDNLDVAALQALAASKNVPTVGIEKDKDKLITAIKAANEPAL